MTVRCDKCGRFFRWGEPGSSSLFVPDSPFTIEEVAEQCASCTDTHGPPLSRQNVRRDIVVDVVPAEAP